MTRDELAKLDAKVNKGRELTNKIRSLCEQRGNISNALSFAVQYSRTHSGYINECVGYASNLPDTSKEFFVAGDFAAISGETAKELHAHIRETLVKNLDDEIKKLEQELALL